MEIRTQSFCLDGASRTVGDFWGQYALNRDVGTFPTSLPIHRIALSLPLKTQSGSSAERAIPPYESLQE